MTILATNLYIPPPPSKVVARTRLTGQITTGTSAGYKLTLISAPAGFGKSTLVSEWIASPLHGPPGQVYNEHVAWLSLVERDSDPARYLTYLVAALQTVVENSGEGVLEHTLR